AGAADRQTRSIGEDGDPALFAIRLDARDPLEVHDGGAMDPDETGWIEHRLQSRDRLLLQKALAGAVERDVVILGFGVIELVERNDVNARPVLDDDTLRTLFGWPGRLGEVRGGSFHPKT